MGAQFLDATSAQFVRFGSCDGKPSPCFSMDKESHCDQEPWPEMYGSLTGNSYPEGNCLSLHHSICLFVCSPKVYLSSPSKLPPHTSFFSDSEMNCLQNCHYTNVINHLNVRETTKDGHHLIHFYEMRFNQSGYIHELKSYTWHVQRKFLNELELIPFIDFDVGFQAAKGRTQMWMRDEKRRAIELKNLTFSASLQENADLLTSRIAPCLPNPSQLEYMALWVYHLLESSEILELMAQRQIQLHEMRNEREQADGIRRIFERNEEGHARPIGEAFHHSGEEPESRLDRWLKRPPRAHCVFSNSYPWYNDQDSTSTRITRDNQLFKSLPSMAYIATTVERIYNARRPRNNREMLLMPCFQFWREKRKEFQAKMLPEKKEKVHLIKKKILTECEMELPSDVRVQSEVERYNGYINAGMRLPRPFSNQAPIRDQTSYSGRCLPQPNQLRLCEIQVCPSISKATETDEQTRPHILNEQPPVVFLISQFLEKAEVSDCEKTHLFPEHFDSKGDDERYLKSCELIVMKDDQLIPSNLERFLDDEEVYDDRIGLANFHMIPKNPSNRRKFR